MIMVKITGLICATVLVAMCVGCGLHGFSKAETGFSVGSVKGHILADDFPSLQDAINALGDKGGTIYLSARTYKLHKPLRIRKKVVLAGALDAKTREPCTWLNPASDFTGDAIIETIPSPASENEHLNADIQIRDLIITGRKNISGLKMINGDVLRLERCRIAHVHRCVDMSILTYMSRPYPAKIVPGGLFINNCIFHAYDICLNLEYATQNRIYSNWFVSNMGVALRLKNTNKTWFMANEINQFKRAAILLEDDGDGNPVHNINIALNWMWSNHPNVKYIEVIGAEYMSNISATGNTMLGNDCQIDLPFAAKNRGHVFSNNGGAGCLSETSGEVRIASDAKRVTVTHGLISKPQFINVTPEGSPTVWWIENRTSKSFDIVIQSSASKEKTLLWHARIQ